MANNNRNQKLVNGAQQALDKMKYEIASEFGVNLGGETASRLKGRGAWLHSRNRHCPAVKVSNRGPLAISTEYFTSNIGGAYHGKQQQLEPNPR